MKHKMVAIGREEEWMVEDAMRTLMRAREIKCDKKLMEKVRTLAKKRLEDTASLVAATGDDD